MQESLQKISQQITEYWNQMERKKKISLIVTSLFVLLVVTALIFRLTRTKYEVLYSNLNLKDMGQITTKLDEMGVPWKSDNDNRDILVPAENKDRIKIELATYGLPKEGYSFMDAFNDSSWTMTDYDKKQRIKHAQQSELANTIAGIDGIQSAEVFISEKETSNFVLSNSDNTTTASVKITKSDTRPLSAEKVRAIKHLVAGPISDLDPENVSIIDEEGRLLGEENEEDIFNSDLLTMKQNLETRINESIKRFLENVVGYGNVDVMSSVKVNMDSEKTTIVEFTPPIEGNEEGLIRSLEEVEEHMVGGAAGGVPGAEPNVEDYSMIDDSTSRYDKVSRLINNELNEINKEIRKAPGQVESITVAVLINEDALSDGIMSTDKQREFTDLIYAATGLDTKQVEVKAARFNKEVATTYTEGSGMNWLLIGIVILGVIISLIFLILYLRARNRKINQEEIQRLLEEKSSIELEVADLDFEMEESRMKAQINMFIEKKPDSVAQLLRNWLNE